MGLSYRRAWLLLDSLNKSFDVPVTINSVGGRGGGGVQVTDFGMLLVSRYRKVEQQFSKNRCREPQNDRTHVRSVNTTAVRRVTMAKKTPGAASVVRALVRPRRTPHQGPIMRLQRHSSVWSPFVRLSYSAAINRDRTTDGSVCRKKARNENVLNLFIWADDIAPDALTSFERQTGIKVHVSYFDSPKH